LTVDFRYNESWLTLDPAKTLVLQEAVKLSLNSIWKASIRIMYPEILQFKVDIKK
jgi:hypothetical protein